MIKIINDNGMIWAVAVCGAQVAFYDCRYEHRDLGQFVSAYFIDTILNHDPLCDLSLDGGIPCWSISAKGMRRINAWLREVQ